MTLFDGRLKKIDEEKKLLTKEVRERTLGYIVAAFSVVAGLAWNEAVKSLIDLLPQGKNTVFAKFAYAIVITLVVVVVTVYLGRLIQQKGEETSRQ